MLMMHKEICVQQIHCILTMSFSWNAGDDARRMLCHAWSCERTNILNKCVKQGKYCIRAYIGRCWCAIHVWRSMPLRCPCWKLLLSKSAQHIWLLACTFSSQPPTCHTKLQRNFHRNNFEGNMTMSAVISLQERIVPHKVSDPSPSSSQENRSDECLLILSAPNSGFVR